MSLISVVVTLIVIGLLLWLVNNYLPIDAGIKNIIYIVVVVGIVFWLLSVFGVLGQFDTIHIGR